MILFIDASALVAIMALEPGYGAFRDQLDGAEKLITSPVARWETIRALESSYRYDHEQAEIELEAFLMSNDIHSVAIGDREAKLALEAHRRFGKGNHDARLNMGDCFAYACAKTNDARLLYKGDDFARTDMA